MHPGRKGPALGGLAYSYFHRKLESWSREVCDDVEPMMWYVPERDGERDKGLFLLLWRPINWKPGCRGGCIARSNPSGSISATCKYKHIEEAALPSMACNRQFPLVATVVLLLGLLAPSLTRAQYTGVSYGTLGDNLPPPAEVIGMFKSHKVPKMRIYAPSEPILRALRGSNIDLLLDAPGPLDVLARDKAAAREWVRTNVLAYWPDVRFRYIAVGNEEILKPGVAEHIYPAMLNIYDALSSAGLQGQIKVSTSIQYSALGESFPPSTGEFSQQVLPLIRPIVSFLARTGAPLLINVYPYFAYASNPSGNDLDYALFTSPGTVGQDPNSGLEYQNMFDDMVDAVYFALDKVGGAGVDVVVSETGWPTDAGVEATVNNARTYNTNLVRHVGKGTPKKPGKAVETYIFAMFNENLKKPAGIENHWGLFYPDKQPVYPISF